MGVELFFQLARLWNEYFLLDMGVDAKVLFEDLQLQEQDAVEGFVVFWRFVQADGLADVFQLVFCIVVIAQEAIDRIVATGYQEAGKVSGTLAGFAKPLDIREKKLSSSASICSERSTT